MNNAKNLEEVRELNLSTVLRLIHRKKVCSRAELAKMTGLQQSTVTNIINQLIECGLVTETGIIEGRKGRRSIGVTLTNDKYQVIGARLSRDSYSVERFHINGEYDAVIRRDFETGCAIIPVLENIRRDIQSFIDSASLPIVAIGLSVPGPFKVYESKFMNITYMSGMEDVNLKEFFSDYFDIPTYIEHDANAGILAEKWFGLPSMEKGTYIYIAAGYGIGAGVMIDGSVFHGSIGIAGEIGHMSINFDGPRCVCGNVGCLEMYASSHAVSQRVKDLVEKQGHKTAAKSYAIGDILEAYNAGDELVCEVVLSAADYLAKGLANIMNVFNPNGIIIGDVMSKFGEAYFKRVISKASEYISADVFNTTKFYRSSFSQDAALVGAGALAIDKAMQHPTRLIERVRAAE